MSYLDFFYETLFITAIENIRFEKYLRFIWNSEFFTIYSRGRYLLNTTLQVPGVGFSVARPDRAKFGFYPYRCVFADNPVTLQSLQFHRIWELNEWTLELSGFDASRWRCKQTLASFISRERSVNFSESLYQNKLTPLPEPRAGAGWAKVFTCRKIRPARRMTLPSKIGDPAGRVT